MKPATLNGFVSQINWPAFLTEGLFEIVRPVLEDRSAGFERCRMALERRVMSVLEDDIGEYRALCGRCGIELDGEKLAASVTENLGVDEMMLTLYLNLELIGERIEKLPGERILGELRSALSVFDEDLREALESAPAELKWTVENMTGISTEFFRAPEDCFYDDEFGWVA